MDLPENAQATKRLSPSIFADLVGKLAAFIHQRMTAERLSRLFGFMKKLSTVLMTVIIALLPLIGLFFALKFKAAAPFWIALGVSVTLAFLQYASRGFLIAMEKLLHNSSAQLTTHAIPHALGIAIIAAALGIAVSAFMDSGVFVAVRLIAALGLFLLGCVYMAPVLIRAEINEQNSPGQDLVGLVSCLLNGLIFAFPMLYAGAGLSTIFLLLGGIFEENVMIEVSSVMLALKTGFLPIAFYLIYILYYLLLDLIKSVLAIPEIARK